jgi:peptidoglycan DL-endopeptidase CwlO
MGRSSITLLFLAPACAMSAPVGGGSWIADGYRPFSWPAALGTEPAPPIRITEPSPPPLAPQAREAAVATARRLIGASRIVVGTHRYHDDCTGLVRAVYGELGVDLMTEAETGDNAVTAIYRYTSKHGRVFDGGRPLPGDLIFFRETYDRNRDGRRNDGLTHIGLVEEVQADGTVLVIHRVPRGVVRYRMNLGHPDATFSADGRRWNDWLRSPTPGTWPRLTGQLFAAYGTLLPTESRPGNGH